MEENQEIRSAALDLDTLKTRAARCVCKYCGSPLKVERIMYHNCEAARSELFCPKCGRIEFGVEREVYLAANTTSTPFILICIRGWKTMSSAVA